MPENNFCVSFFGEKYRIRVKGYRGAGSSQAYILIKASGTDVGWTGATLPNGVASESWIEQTVTIPAGATTLQAGLVWNTVTASEIMYLNEFEITKLTNTSATPEYQYNLTDHLGNVRVTFTTKAETNQSLATLEAANVAQEQSQFVYYDEAIRISSYLFDHTDQPGTAPATQFYRGINLNGPAMVIDGNNWVSSTGAANFTATSNGAFENQAVTLSPVTDANRTTMIRSSLYGNISLTVSSVPNGTYDVYLYVWEDNSSETYSVSVEGVTRQSNYISGSGGTWTKLGPFRTLISDGTINIGATGDSNVSGVELWTVVAPGGNQPPVVSSYLQDQTAQEGLAFSYTFLAHTFTDPDVGTALTYTATLASGSALPAWLTLNSSTRTISGTPAAATAGYIDIRITASDGSGGTVSDVFTLAVTTSAASTFYKGLNLNGPAIAIDGNSWLASSTAPGFSFTADGGTFENQAITLVPSTDANRATMLRSSIWGYNINLAVASIPTGIYDVSVYAWEDNDPTTYALSLEGASVVPSYFFSGPGVWTKFGPFRKTISDGTINISANGQAANLSGVEIKSVTTTIIPVTAVSVSPSPLNLLIGKTSQLSRTITPSNATIQSVAWTTSNAAIATVNNDGWVTAVSVGSATITATINGFSSPATVNVSAPVTSYSTRLTGTANEKYGLAKTLSVMPGDIITTEVYAKYLDTNSNNWNAALTNLMAAIAGGTAPAGTFIDGGAAGSIGGTTFPFVGVLPRTGDSGTGPKAYLNYIVFDKNYVYKTGGFKRLSATPKENGTDVPHERLAFDGAQQIVITEPGYVYIYLSNENDTPVEVYFDDFKVQHIKGPIVSTQDYYPFGLTYNSYVRENSVNNTSFFQGKEIQNDLALNVYDFGWRHYDAAIGRASTKDPHSSSYPNTSPYSFLSNNPLNVIDPTGMDTVNIPGDNGAPPTVIPDATELPEVVITPTDDEPTPYSTSSGGGEGQDLPTPEIEANNGSTEWIVTSVLDKFDIKVSYGIQAGVDGGDFLGFNLNVARVILYDNTKEPLDDGKFTIENSADFDFLGFGAGIAQEERVRWGAEGSSHYTWSSSFTVLGMSENTTHYNYPRSSETDISKGLLSFSFLGLGIDISQKQ